MDDARVIIYTLIWIVIVGITYVVGNTMVLGHIDPVMNETAYNADFVDHDRYTARATVIKAGFNIGCFILALIPFAYIFVRLLFKKERTSPPFPGQTGGGW